MAANSGKEIIPLLETLDHCDYSPLTGRGRFAGLESLVVVDFMGMCFR